MSAASATTNSTSYSSSSPTRPTPPWPRSPWPDQSCRQGVDGWTVVACAPRRRLGTLTRDRDPSGRVAWRAWTRAGDPVQVAGVCWWRRRLDAGAALAWVTPVSGARCLALAAYARALPDRQLHELLRGLPRERFDRLVEVAYRPEGSAA